MAAAGRHDRRRGGFREAVRRGHASSDVIEFLTFDQENPNSIRSCLRAARENARSVREIISSDMWEQLNEFYLLVNAAAADAGSRTDPQDLLRSVKRAGHLFTGVTDATMTHNESWHFCRLGRMLERADKTSRILDVKYFLLLPTAADVGTTSDDIQWAAVLRSASAFEMYRKRHGRIAPDRIVEFLLLDTEFPRAIQYCLARRASRCTPSRARRPGCSGIPSNACSASSAPSSRTRASRPIITAGLHEYPRSPADEDEPGGERNLRNVLRRTGCAARPESEGKTGSRRPVRV